MRYKGHPLLIAVLIAVLLVVVFGIAQWLPAQTPTAGSQVGAVRRVRTLLPEDNMPGRIAVSPDGETLLVGGSYLYQYIDNVGHKSQIYLLDLKTARPRWRLSNVTEDGLIYVDWLPDGKRWVACWGVQKSQHFVVLVGSAEDGRTLQRWEIPDKAAGFGTFTVHPDGKHIMLHDGFDLTKDIVVNVENGSTKEIDKNETNFHHSLLSRDGTLRLTGATGGRAILDEYPSGKNIWTVKLDRPPAGISEYPGVGFLENDTKAIVFGLHKMPTTILDVKTGKELYRTDDIASGPKHATVAWDGSFFVIYDGGVLDIWTTLSEQEFPGDALPSDHVVDGHQGQIQTLDVSPDGTRIATGSQDNSIKIWDFVTRNAIRSLDENDAAGWNAVKFSPDGSLVLGAGYSNEDDVRPGLMRLAAILASDLFESRIWEMYVELFVGFTYHFDFTRGIVRLWNAETGEAICRIGMPRRCWAADFSPDGRRFAIGSEDGKIYVFDAVTKTLVNTFDLQYPVWSVAYDKSGKKLLVGIGTGESGWETMMKSWKVGRIKDDYGAAVILETETGKELLRFEGHRHTVFDAAFSPDENLVLTASRDGTARLWDAATQKERYCIDNHFRPARSVDFSKDGSRFAVGSYDDRYGTRIYDTESGEPLCHAAIGSVLTLKFSHDDKMLLIGSGSRAFYCKAVANMIDSREEPLPNFRTVEDLWHAKQDQNRKIGVENPLEKLDIDKERQRVAEEKERSRELRERSHRRDGFSPIVKEIETRISPEKDENLLGYVDWMACNEESVHRLFFGPDDKYLYVYGNNLHRFDWQSGKEISRWKNHAVPFTTGTDGRRILFASGRYFSLYDLERERVIRCFTDPEDEDEWFWWRNLHASADASFVFASGDSTKDKIRLWNTATGQTVWDFTPGRGFNCEPSCYDIAPDNSKIAIGFLSGKILRVDLDPIREKRFLKIQPSPKLLRFSPDGTKLLAVSVAGKTVLWNADTGKRLWKIGRYATQVCFTPDGQAIAFIGDEQIDFLKTSTGRLTGSQTISRTSHNNPIALSPDCTKIAYLDDAGYLRVLRVDLSR